MRLHLLLLCLLTAAVPALAQKAAVTGTVVDSTTGAPLRGILVTLDNQGLKAVTGPNGDFLIQGAKAGDDALSIANPDFDPLTSGVELVDGQTVNVGNLILRNANPSTTFYEDQEDIYFDENAIEDEEGASQAVGALTGASDNIYYNASNYDWNLMRFRFRGYNSEYSDTYINGIKLNDLARGRFNYSSLGGLNRAFRNKSVAVGLGASTHGFGDIGGATNISTITDEYAPGFYGSAMYTNSNYMLRGMVLYSTGINPHGWGVTVGAVARWANEGVIEGTFYHSYGYFLSAEKRFNSNNRLVLTAFGAPTERATPQMTYQEAMDLDGSNLYNPGWGWQDGKKRSARVTKTFDPTFMLNWLSNPSHSTSINTGVAARWINYSNSALNWYNAADPRPDYYRYLPSYYADDQAAYDLYTEYWANPVNRQIKWDNLYQANYLNNYQNATEGTDKGSTYILERRHSNQFNFILNSTVNHRLNSVMTLQGGANFNYTNAHYYKTIDDLLGGEFWRDIDTYAERDFPDDPSMLQNNLNDPNRKVGKGDTFGYDYNIHAIQAQAWIQNMIALPKWDIDYALKMSYTQFYRDGNMRNGRAPDNSYGKGKTHRFDNGGVKAGAVYKLDGHNFFSAHAGYESRAPLFEYAYVSPRIKDTAIDGLQSERIASFDVNYTWNYRRFRGQISGFWTEMMNQTERSSFYDDYYSTFMNYALKDVHKAYRGVELGLSYKITQSIAATFAGTYARYQYRNNPMGVRSYENGAEPDKEARTYLKNYYVGGTPQAAFNIGIDYQAPKMWFFNINGSWMGDSYVMLAPTHHEALPELWQQYPDMAALEDAVIGLSGQDKLKNAFVLNLSIGKVLYVNRKLSLNFNLNIDNVLNNRNVMTYGYQQGRFDYKEYNANKFENKFSYAQGIKVMFNVGVRF